MAIQETNYNTCEENASSGDIIGLVRGITFDLRPIHCAINNNAVIFEGDIVIGTLMRSNQHG